MLGADDELAVAPFRGGRLTALAAGFKPTRGPLVAVVDGSPARTYWISKDKLIRRKVSSDGVVGPIEVLATDAADYTRVSAAHAEAPGVDVVLYIGRLVSKELERRARMWVEAKGSKDVTPDGAGATSVSVVSLGGGRMALLSLDARLSMSPVHARYLELDASGAPHLGEDQVVYVAGPAEGRVAFAGVRLGLGPAALFAISKDTTTFGLLSLKIGYGEGEAPASWLLYPNGISPAPIATAWACGKPMVAFVQPEDATANAREALVVASLDPDAHVDQPVPIAFAPSIKAVAIAAAPPAPADAAHGQGHPPAAPGAWVVYSAESTLRARPVLCH